VKVTCEGKLDGYINMARDVELLRLAESGAAGARVYEWDGPWVSLGQSQNPTRDLRDATLVPWVIRPTGGKAVLHGHDLTVTIALPLEDSDPSRAVRSVYRKIIAPLVRALNNVDVRAALGEETCFVTRGLKTADCFRHISANDVVDPRTGRKLIGCALRVTKLAALAQCSIPVAIPLVDPARVYAYAHVPMPLEVDKERLVENIVGQIQLALLDGHLTLA